MFFYYLCPVQPPLKKCTFRFNFWYISFCGLYIPEKKEILINCYNGEEEELFGEYITKNYKADKKLHWDYLTDRGICWRVNFKFYDGNNEYWGGIDFNEEEIFNAFGEFSQEEDLKLSIYINKGRSMASVKLTNGKKEVWLTNNKIVINKVN